MRPSARHACHVTYVVIDAAGQGLTPVVSPALVGRAGRSGAGAIGRAATVRVGGARWRVGEESLLTPPPLTIWRGS